MRFIRHGDSHAIRFEDGDLFPDDFLEFLKEEGVRSGSFMAIGAVRWARIAFFDVESRQYVDRQLDEQLEVLALVGNVAIHEGDPLVHAHITLGRPDGSALGGHLRQAEIRPTLELMLQGIPELTRKVDPNYGLPTLEL